MTSNALPSEIDQYCKSKAMGYGSFVTIWVLYFTIATFIVKMIYILIPSVYFKYAFEFLFPLSYSYSFIITICYWPLLFLDYENFYPRFENGTKMPITTDICYHFIPLISLFILRRFKNSSSNSEDRNSENNSRDRNSINNSINTNNERIQYENSKNRSINLTFIILTGLIYQSMANYIFYKSKLWPYPFMNKFNQLTVNFMIFGGIISTSLVYLIFDTELGVFNL